MFHLVRHSSVPIPYLPIADTIKFADFIKNMVDQFLQTYPVPEGLTIDLHTTVRLAHQLLHRLSQIYSTGSFLGRRVRNALLR